MLVTLWKKFVFDFFLFRLLFFVHFIFQRNLLFAHNCRYFSLCLCGQNGHQLKRFSNYDLSVFDDVSICLPACFSFISFDLWVQCFSAIITSGFRAIFKSNKYLIIFDWIVYDLFVDNNIDCLFIFQRFVGHRAFCLYSIFFNIIFIGTMHNGAHSGSEI